MESNKSDIIIDQYIQGQLSGEALKEFEALLEKDTALQEEVNFAQYAEVVLHKKLSTKAVQDEVDQKLQPLLTQFGDQYFTEAAFEQVESNAETVQPETRTTPTPTPTLIKRLLPFAMVAAAAALLLFVYWNSTLFLPHEHEKLYANFYEPEKTINTQSPTNALTDFDKGTQQYNNKKYQEAIPHFEKSVDENINRAWALIYTGNAQMELTQMDEAIQTFQQLKTQYPDFANKANWYLALCQLRQGNTNLTIETLKRISPDAKEYNKAQQLLKKL